MSEDVAYRLRIAGEDAAHHVAVRELSRQILTGIHGWLDGLLPEDVWEHESISSASTRCAELFPKRFGPRHGKFSGQPGGPDAWLVRAQLLIWHKQGWPFFAAFIARDTDGDPRRRLGAEQAIASFPHGLPRPVLLAYAAPEVEAWYVAGFEASDDDERTRLAALIDELGFNPVLQAARLTAKHQSDPKDAKRVRMALTAGDRERETACLEHAARRDRAGADTGLPEFLDQVRGELAPVFVR